MAKFKPKDFIEVLGNRVAVAPMPTETRTQGGLYRPATEQGTSPQGMVVSVGRECHHKLSKGDVVAYVRDRGQCVLAEDGTEFLVLNYDEVLAVVPMEGK